MKSEITATGRIGFLSRLVRVGCYLLAVLVIGLLFWNGEQHTFGFNADMSMEYIEMPNEIPEELVFEIDELGDQFDWLLLFDVLTVVLFLFVLYHLERLFSSYQQHIFYASENTKRLHNIGIVLVVIALLQPIQNISFYFFTKDIPLPEPVQNYTVGLAMTLDFPLMIAGLVLMAISKVLADALRLQEEAELTI